jgi:hypothetical protein
MSNTGFTVTGHGDLSTIFKARTSAAGLDTNFIASDGRDLNDWFEISTIPGDQIAYDTNYICDAYGDLKNAFMDINYNPDPFTATGAYSTIKDGNNYAIQFTGTSGTINFNVGGIYINCLVIGGAGAGMGKSSTTSNAQRKGGGGGSLILGSFTCLQNTDYTISAGTAGLGGATFNGSPGNSSSIILTGQGIYDINVTASGGTGGTGHTGNNNTTHSINYNSIALTYSYGNSGFDSSVPSNNAATRGSGGGVNGGAGSGYNGGVGGLAQTFSNNATMSFGNGGGGSGFNNPLFASGNGGSGSQGVVVLWFTYP